MDHNTWTSLTTSLEICGHVQRTYWQTQMKKSREKQQYMVLRQFPDDVLMEVMRSYC